MPLGYYATLLMFILSLYADSIANGICFTTDSNTKIWNAMVGD